MGLSRALGARIVIASGLVASLWACSAIAGVDQFEAAEGEAGSSGNSGGGRGGSSGRGGTGGSGDSGMSAPDAGGQDAAIADAGGEGDGGGEPAPVLGCESPRTLCVRLRSFGAHVIELVQLDLVTNAGNNLRARAILDPFARSGVEDADIVMPLALSADDVPAAGEDSPLHIEMFADENRDGSYTIGEDHDWNLDLPPDAKLVFEHSSAFSAIDPPPRGLGGDFRMRLRDLDDHVGDLLELMVIEKASGRTVGLYRTHALSRPDLEIVIPDIIDPSLTDGYVIELYADVDGDYAYDATADRGWRLEGVPADDGLELELEDLPAELSYQLPFDDGR